MPTSIIKNHKDKIQDFIKFLRADKIVKYYRSKFSSKKKIIILAYHRVTFEETYLTTIVNPETFTRQINYLKETFDIISLDEAIERIKHKEIDSDYVVITFDDGYRDNFQFAYPILRQNKIPATIFLTTAPINSNGLLWDDKIDLLLRHTKVDTRTIKVNNQDTILKIIQPFSGAPKCLKQKIVIDFVEALKKIGEKRKKQILSYLESFLRDFEWKDVLTRRMLSWDEVREMADNGICFGAHTCNHPILTRLPLKNAAIEIRQSRSEIEKHLNRPIKHFAYPNGESSDYNEDIIELIEKNKFLSASSLIYGSNGSTGDLYRLKRCCISEMSISAFIVKIARILAFA